MCWIWKNCDICRGEKRVFSNFAQLNQHMYMVHRFEFCDICVEHLNLFTRERRFYSRIDLERHFNEGDSDDKSHKGKLICRHCVGKTGVIKIFMLWLLKSYEHNLMRDFISSFWKTPLNINKIRRLLHSPVKYFPVFAVSDHISVAVSVHLHACMLHLSIVHMDE